MRNATRAFTLIELLVVVSIIALLISILLPSLSAARAQAKGAACLANLKRIAVQGAMYADEYDAYPPVRLKKAPDATGTMVDYYHRIHHAFRRKAPRWQWFLSSELGPVVNPDSYADEASFNSSMKIENKYWEDPALREYTNDVRNGAYGYNGTYLGNTRDESNRWIRFPVRTSRVSAPSQTILAGDSRGGDKPHGKHSYWLDPPKKARYGVARGKEQAFGPNASKPGETLGHSPVEARHRGRGNVAFCDGHAKAKSLRELGYHVDEQSGEVVPAGSIDRTRADNSLWTGTYRDDLPSEYVRR